MDVLDELGALAPLVISAAKALVVLVVGWIVAGAVGGMVRRKVNASETIDNTLGNFIASIVKWVILLMVLVAVLGIFGIEATSLVAMMGAATLAIGLALVISLMVFGVTNDLFCP